MKKISLIIAGFIAGAKFEEKFSNWVFNGGFDKAKIKFIKKLYKFLTGCDFDDRYEDSWEKYGPPKKRMNRVDYEQYYSTRRNHNGR